MTAIDATADSIAVRKLYISGDAMCKRPYPLGNRFVVDLETNNFGIVEDESGWYVWRKLVSDDLLLDSAGINNADSLHAGLMDIPLKVFARSLK